MGQCAHSLGECQWDLWIPLPDKTRPVHLFPYRACLPVGSSLGHSRTFVVLSCPQQVLCPCGSLCFLYYCAFCYNGSLDSRVVTAIQFCTLSVQEDIVDYYICRTWRFVHCKHDMYSCCLLYTSDAADDLLCVD